MPLGAKTRLAKRKHEHTRKENQTLTSKKHDTKCFENTTEDLISDLKEAKDNLKLNKALNHALLEKVKDNKKAIEILKGKEKKHIESIKSLQATVEKLQIKKSLNSTECQTIWEDINIPCVFTLQHARKN